MIAGLLARIDSFPYLHSAHSVVCGQHMAPENLYFDVILKNIIFLKVSFPIGAIA